MASEGAVKLASIFNPLLDEVKKEIKNHITALTQEILMHLGRLETRIDVLEKLVGEKKKTVTRGEKKTSGSDAATEPQTGQVQIQQPAGSQKTFPQNKMIYFREQYKVNKEYRKKYKSEEIKKLMKADATIAGKTQKAQKLIAQATFCYNYIKTNDNDTLKAIEAEFAEARSAHEASNKPPQQVVEAKTPPSN